jgi:hypothetical protein
VYVTALRYKWPPEKSSVAKIIEMIVAFGLNGDLLGSHELKWLRDKTNFRLSMVQLTDLLRSRFALEYNPRVDSRFKIVPHDFAIEDWVNFKDTEPTEVDAFYEFCCMALAPSFLGSYWMPKYAAKIDPTGKHVARFVREYLL